MTSEIQTVADNLQLRADACIANGERLQACGLIEAVQAIRRLAPVAVKAPEPAPKPVEPVAAYTADTEPLEPVAAYTADTEPLEPVKTPRRPWKHAPEKI